MQPKNASQTGYDRFEQFAAAPRKALWTLSVPVLVGMSIQTLYMIVDMVFVGRVGSDALTALSFNLPLGFLVMGVVFGLGSGITAIIAQAVGARDQDQANWTAEHAVMIGIVMTVCFTSLGLFFGIPLLKLLGVPPEILPFAWDYFKIVVAGYGIMIAAIFLRSMLSGEGEVKTPVIIQTLGTLLNIVLDPLFIFTFGLGVQGAALATVISQTLVAGTLFYIFFVKDRAHVRIRMRGFRWRSKIFADMVRVGAPASLSFLIMGLGGVIFNRILVEFSADAVAAQQIGMRLDHIVILPVVAIAYSLVTLVGMFYGAGRFDLVRGIVRYSLACTVSIGAGVAVFFMIFAPQLVKIFTDDESIRALAVQYLRIFALAYPVFPITMITGRVWQAFGRGMPELVLSLLRVLLIAVPLALFFCFVLEYPVHFAWISMVVGSWSSAAFAAAWLRVALLRAEERKGDQAR